MKSLILLTILLSYSAQAELLTPASTGSTDYVTVNNRFIDLSDPTIKRTQIVMIGNTAVTARIVGVTGMPMYQPPSGTKAEIIGIQGLGSGAASSGRFGYGDNHTTGGAIPTNPVYCWNTGASGEHYSLAVDEQKDFPCMLNIPSGKYIFANQTVGTDGIFDIYVRETPE